MERLTNNNNKLLLYLTNEKQNIVILNNDIKYLYKLYVISFTEILFYNFGL